MNLLERLIDEKKTRLYIGGEWRDAGDGRTITDRNPATEEVLAEVASATADDAVAAVAAAYDAFAEWAKTPPRHRAELLRRAHELMIERTDELAYLITLENGKTLADARGEVRYAAEFFRWFSEEAVRNLGEVYRAPGGDKTVMVVNQPVGVSVLVTPWNFPLSMGTRKIGPALAAGCTTVLKPASDTPLIALALADLLAEVGVPAGVVNVVPADRSAEVVDAMLEDPRTRKLSFTGSTATGKVLLRKAADQVLRVSMELGGNAPFVVFADADLDAALEGALLAKMRNAGEACTAANRFYVEAPVADEFSRRMAAAMAQLEVGPGWEDGVDVGPLVNRSTQAKVAELVEATKDAGADILVGGRVPERRGWFYEPTVISGLSPDAPILRYEIFGPVAPVVPFETEAEAIRWANDTEYGLISYVYSGDLGRALRVAEAMESGMVAVNRGLISDPAAPFGGVKQSGLGREGAHHGLMEFLEPKYIGVDW